MMTDLDYRNQLQQIRQTARAQVLAIRQARLLRDRLAGAADGPQQKRLRRARRLALLSQQAQDARLEAALEAGRIELWTPVEPVDLPLVVDDTIVGDFFGPPWDPALADIALPSEVCFGPHLPPALSDGPGEALLTLSPGMRIGRDAGDAVTDMPVLAVDQGVAWDGADEADWDDDADWDDVLAASVVVPHAVGGEPDLMALPGAGPGLIWMLQKCGITTLADLAETDAAALVPKLGLVGQIVDIHGWQSFARRRVGSAPRSVTG